MGCGKRGCCLGSIISFVVVVVIIVVLISVFLNMTPNKLGIGDEKFIEGEYSLNDMGLGDVKIKDLYKMIKSLFDVNEADIVDNPFDAAADAQWAEENLEGADGVGHTAGGDIDFTGVFEDYLEYDNEYLLTYQDTTLAYMLNKLIAQGGDTEEASEVMEDLESLKNLNANIVQVSIIQTGEGYQLKQIFKIDLSKSKKDADIPGIILNLIPDSVYITSVNNLSADSEGKLVTESETLIINGFEQAALINAILMLIVPDDMNSTERQGEVNDMMGNAFSLAVSKLGRVGTADTDAAGIVTSNRQLGNSGLGNGLLKILTYTAATLPTE